MKAEHKAQYKNLAERIVRLAIIAAETPNIEQRDANLDSIEDLIYNSLSSAYFDGLIDSLKGDQ